MKDFSKIKPIRKEIPIKDLNFWLKNPRVLDVILDQKIKTQEGIQKLLTQEQTVKQWIHIIKNDGVVHEPLDVKQENGKYIVVEGNQRLCVLRNLYKEEPIEKWSKAPCHIYPKDTPEEYFYMLVGNHHAKGKDRWKPYLRILACWEQRKNGMKMKNIAKYNHTTVPYVQAAFKTMDWMKRKKEPKNRFSYWWEIFNKRPLMEFLEINDVDKEGEPKEKFLNRVLNDVKQKEIPKADNVRQFNDAAKKSKNNLRAYMQGEISFKKLKTKHISSGKNKFYDKIRTFSNWINNEINKKEIINLLNDKEKNDARADLAKTFKIILHHINEIKKRSKLK